MADLNSDWKEWLRLLTEHQVRFVIVGAHALAANGRPRLTGDLDLFLQPSKANATRVLRALRAFGFGELGITEEGATRSDAESRTKAKKRPAAPRRR